MYFSLFNSKLTCLEKSFHKHHQNDKQFTSKSGLHFVGPDLDLNCLQLSENKELKAKS